MLSRILASTAHLILIMLVVAIGACGKTKKVSSESVALAPLTSAADAIENRRADSSSTIENCVKEEEVSTPKGKEKAKEADEDSDDDDETSLKGKDSADNVKKDCPSMPPSTTGSNPASTPSTAAASLAEGQKIYAANCQSCHRALPGEKRGASASGILAASTVGPHKNINPWPAGQASALSAQLAAESLAMAMK